jgi:hypothetical protein
VIVDARDDSASVGPVVVPISLDQVHGGPFDLRISAAESPLGYALSVQVWNGVTMLEEQLGRCVATLPEAAWREVTLLYRNWLGESVPLGALAGRVGPAIGNDRDPRIAFQEREAESLEYLRGPALRRLGQLEEEEDSIDERPVETVGDLVRFAMPDLLDLADERRLMAAWSDPRSVHDLLDFRARPLLLGSLMDQVGVSTGHERLAFSERFLDVVNSLEFRSVGSEPQRLYARRQRGRHGPKP